MADEDNTAEKKIEVLEHTDDTEAEAQPETKVEVTTEVASEAPTGEATEDELPEEDTAATDDTETTQTETKPVGEPSEQPEESAESPESETVNELAPPPVAEEVVVQEPPVQEDPEPDVTVEAEAETTAPVEEAPDETPHALRSSDEGSKYESVVKSQEEVHVQPESSKDASEGDNDAHQPEPGVVSEPGSEEKKAAPVEAAMVAGVSASQAARHPHRNNKKFAALVTVIIGSLLSALAVYLYVTTTSNTEETSQTQSTPSTNTTNEAPEEPATPATPQDVDTTTQEVDDALNELDDALDLSEDALSDESLGL